VGVDILDMLVSVIIPAYRAHGTIARAVESLIAQTHERWEAIVVSDDGGDYQAFLRERSVADERLRFVSTGGVRTGCHNARNVGLAAAKGGVIAALDADDVFYPARLETLAPLALAHGAAVDNPAVVLEDGGAQLYRAFGAAERAFTLGAADLLALSVPLFPLVRRDHALPRIEGIEYGEDFLANLRLIDRLDHDVIDPDNLEHDVIRKPLRTFRHHALSGLRAIPDTLSEYRVVTGSLCHDADSVAAFERTYTDLIARFSAGRGYDLSPRMQAEIVPALSAKRALNRAFGEACKSDPNLNFQTFVAGRLTP
jgi:glycosyltransferase involved in cell wall biosynthesis